MSDLATELVPSEEDRLLQAEQAVRDYCGWHIAPPRTDTVTLAGPVSRRLMLPSLYVTDVVSVTVDGIVQVPDVDYTVHREGYIERRSGWRSWWAADLIEVVFTHGFEFPPASVTAAVQALAQNAIGNPGGLTRKTVGPFAEAYSPSADLLAGLGAYRIIPVS